MARTSQQNLQQQHDASAYPHCAACSKPFRGNKVGACAQCASAQTERMQRRCLEADDRARSAKERLERMLDADNTRHAEEASRARRARSRESQLLARARAAEERAKKLRAAAQEDHKAARALEVQNERACTALEPRSVYQHHCMLEDATRQEYMRFCAAKERLQQQQAAAMHEVLTCVPFKATSENRGGPAGVRLCGMRAPAPLSNNLSEPLPPREAASAIGRLQLVLDLAANVLGYPLLHRGVFQTETSAVWLPDSALRQQQPSPSGGPFLLHMHGGSEARSELPAPTQAASTQSSSTGQKQAVSPLSPSVASVQPPATFAPSRQSFRKGVAVVHRSASQLVAAECMWAHHIGECASPAASLAHALALLANDDGTNIAQRPRLSYMSAAEAAGGELASDSDNDDTDDK